MPPLLDLLESLRTSLANGQCNTNSICAWQAADCRWFLIQDESPVDKCCQRLEQSAPRFVPEMQQYRWALTISCQMMMRHFASSGLAPKILLLLGWWDNHMKEHTYYKGLYDHWQKAWIELAKVFEKLKLLWTWSPRSIKPQLNRNLNVVNL